MEGIDMQSIKGGNVIGKNIRRVRKSRKLTQDVLAAKLQVKGLDISRGTLAKIESGIRHITLEELKTIKEVLKMEYSDFFDEPET